jgi:hypothetical protein
MMEANGLRCACAEKPIALCIELETELEAMKAELEKLRKSHEPE